MDPRTAVALLASAVLLAATACSDRPASSGIAPEGVPVSLWEVVDRPDAVPGAFAPRLAPAADGLLLTWLEPVSGPVTGPGGDGHRLRFAHYAGGLWSAPVTIAQGTDFFANWADVPSVAESEDGTLLAHWLEKTGDATYAYGIRLARSVDGGVSWRDLGFLHDDGTPTEHGFVSFVPAGGDRFRAFWLDGRRMVDDGPMTLRTARVGETVEPSEVVDDRVCECCPTAAVTTSEGPLVAYRDRSPQEVRDVHVRRREADGWSEAVPLHRDGWVFPACPVNGPALAADGDRVAAAWFTAEGKEPRVLAAFSSDGGTRFGPPVEIDRGEHVLGRVDIALAPRRGPEGTGEAVVSWLTSRDEGAIYLRRVRGDGELGEPHQLARTAASRASGIPRILSQSGLMYVTWVWKGEGEPSELGFRGLFWDGLPSPGGPEGG